MKLLKLVVLLPLLAVTGEASGQGLLNKAWNIMQRFSGDTTELLKPRLLVYPTIGYSPETSLDLGLTAILLFHAKNDTTNRLSEIQALGFGTFKGQYGLWLDNAIYGHKDKWFFLGRLRFQRFPLLYFGVGPDAPKEYPAIVNGTYFLTRQRVLRKVFGHVFTGPELDYQQLFNTDIEKPIENKQPLPLGGDGSRNIGIGWGIVYDTRHNVLNVRDGFFAEAAYLDYRDRWGSEYSFHSYNTDVRYFRPLSERNVLAMQATGQFISGEAPFNQLALMGGETIQRGYYTGRYRDKAFVAAQIEHRWLPFAFSKRIGGAVFASAGAVAPSIDKLSLQYVKPTGGAGIRYLLFPKKDIYARLDIAVTPEGFGFYFFTGEAF